MVISLSEASQQQLLSVMFQNANEGIIITDLNGRILDVNPAFSMICGYSRDELIGQNPNLLSSGRQDKKFYQNMWQTIIDDGYWRGEVWNRKKDGSFYVEILTVSTVQLADTNESYYLGIMSDITRLKEHHTELERLAYFDSLTGLPNRNLLEDRFEQAIAHSDRTETLLAVCFLDLDDFKPVNDEFGHKVGDQLLVEATRRIRSTIRSEDTVARIGGDEFVILLSDLKQQSDCQHILQKISQRVSEPYYICGHAINVSTSIGYTLYPLDDGSIETLLMHADQTLYRAKKNGKNMFSMYVQTGKGDEQQRQRQAEIKLALSNQEFCLYFQPKINMRTGKVFGLESLVRWQHPELELIGPNDFLPDINETDIEIALGEWVIEQAFRQIAALSAVGLNLQISVNLSAYHLANPFFLNWFRALTRRYPTLDFSLFQIEILESHALEDLNVIADVVTACKAEFGITTALDDFGTGYSSLSHIRSVPVNTVKIDQTFVRNMLDEPDDCRIVEGVISLAKSFNLNVIAEGVESEKHGQVLLCMGCEDAQGYAIARPMPAAELIDWIKTFRSPKVWQPDFSHQDGIKTCRLRLFSHYLELGMNELMQFINENGHDFDCGWPKVLTKHNHSENWLQSVNNNGLFDESCLTEINAHYQHYNRMLQNLLTLYKCGNIEASTEVFEQVRHCYDELCQCISSKLQQLQNAKA